MYEIFLQLFVAEFIDLSSIHFLKEIFKVEITNFLADFS